MSRETRLIIRDCCVFYALFGISYALYPHGNPAGPIVAALLYTAWRFHKG